MSLPVILPWEQAQTIKKTKKEILCKSRQATYSEWLAQQTTQTPWTGGNGNRLHWGTSSSPEKKTLPLPGITKYKETRNKNNPTMKIKPLWNQIWWLGPCVWCIEVLCGVMLKPE